MDQEIRINHIHKIIKKIDAMEKQEENMDIPELPPTSTRAAGKTDNSGRWYPHDDLLSIPGAFAVRAPSRQWPHSYLKHYFSKKFARLLAMNSPKRYFELSGVDPQSEIGKLIIAEHAKKRILGK